MKKIFSLCLMLLVLCSSCSNAGDNSDVDDVIVHDADDIVSFSIAFDGMDYDGITQYQVEYNQGVAMVVLSGDDYGEFEHELEAEDDLLSDIADVISSYDIRSWEPYYVSEVAVVNGMSFTLDVEFGDESTIAVFGQDAFPANFSEAYDEIELLLKPYVDDYKDSFNFDRILRQIKYYINIF